MSAAAQECNGMSGKYDDPCFPDFALLVAFPYMLKE